MDGIQKITPYRNISSQMKHLLLHNIPTLKNNVKKIRYRFLAFRHDRPLASVALEEYPTTLPKVGGLRLNGYDNLQGKVLDSHQIEHKGKSYSHYKIPSNQTKCC